LYDVGAAAFYNQIGVPWNAKIAEFLQYWSSAFAHIILYILFNLFFWQNKIW
jgi:hypothetical protein